jgi:hypothetical protein
MWDAVAEDRGSGLSMRQVPHYSGSIFPLLQSIMCVHGRSAWVSPQPTEWPILQRPA